MSLDLNSQPKIHFSKFSDQIVSTFGDRLNFEFDSGLRQCVGGSQRFVFGTLRPTQREQIIEILRIARETKMPLYPTSTGRNWGLGSTNPAADGAVILDLSGLKNILKIDTELGYAQIEPGVTQEQLSCFLKKQNSDFFVDVTGSAANTSIIGNALDRGIGYNQLRVDTVTRLEVLLGTGEIIVTGFGHYGDSEISHLYRHGLGPSLDGLFFQSNFGIVLSATICLMKKPERISSFLLKISDDSIIPKVCEELRNLKMEGYLNCIAHLFNSERFVPAFSPHISKYYENLGQPKSKVEIEKILRHQMGAEWLVAGNIKGDSTQVKNIEHILKRRLRKFGQLTVFNQRFQKALSFLQHIPGFHLQKSLLYSQKVVGDLTTGQPTYGTMASIQWPIVGAITDEAIIRNPDLGKAGFVYLLLFAPLNQKSAKDLIEITQEISAGFNLKPAITLNVITDRILEAVISFSFNRDIEFECTNAKACVDKLQSVFIKKQFFPYRTHIDLMGQMIDPNSTHWLMVSQLKRVFDPDNIISPKRYCP